MSDPTRALEILLVEDNSGDVELTREAFAESEYPNRILVARDGFEAMRTLDGLGPAGADYVPDIILLDLNLPRKGGHEVLQEIKASSRHKRIPVLILSSSGEGDDIIGAYERHANSYMRKPRGMDQLVRLVRTVEDYWLTHASLPTKVPGDA